MSKIVIKKRVSLDFLGEDYSKAYLVFQSIPISDYETILDEVEKSETNNDTRSSLKMTRDYLKKYFLSGKFPDEKGELQDVSQDDLDGLDKDSAVICFQKMTGQEVNENYPDPKDEKTSEATSETVAPTS